MRIIVFFILLLGGCASRNASDTSSDKPIPYDVSGDWVTIGGYTVYRVRLQQNGERITGKGIMDTCVAQNERFSVSGRIYRDRIILWFDYDSDWGSEGNFLRITFGGRDKKVMFLDPVHDEENLSELDRLIPISFMRILRGADYRAFPEDF